MRFLIVGLGSVGQRHWRNLLTLGGRDFVFVRTGLGKLDNSALSQVPTVPDIASGLAYQPKAVVIANPTAFHIETALASVRAGCHVLIEKPIGHRLTGCDELEALAAERGCAVLVGYQFRFHPGLQQLRQFLNDGAIGQPVSVQAHWGEFLPGWHPWEDYRHSYSARRDLGGGVTLTLSHPIDYLLWLLGDIVEVQAVSTRAGSLDIEGPDTIHANLQFSNGTIGQLHLDYIQQPATHWLQVIGQQGTLQWYNPDGLVRCYRAGTHQWERYPVPANFERNNMFLSEMQHFLQCIAGQAQPMCTVADGRRALQVALAVDTAVETKTTVRI